MPLVAAMMALMLLTGLATVLILGTMTETAVVASYRRGIETFYAADAAAEFAVRDLARAPDWDAVVSGDAWSTFVDGAPGGPRRVGAATVDLTQATAEVAAIVAARSDHALVGLQLYAYGLFGDLAPPAVDRPPMYLCVWVAEFAGDEADEPPAERVLHVIARAYGSTGGQRSVAVTVARPVDSDGDGDSPLELRSWEELR